MGRSSVKNRNTVDVFSNTTVVTHVQTHKKCEFRLVLLPSILMALTKVARSQATLYQPRRDPVLKSSHAGMRHSENIHITGAEAADSDGSCVRVRGFSELNPSRFTMHTVSLHASMPFVLDKQSKRLGGCRSGYRYIP